jgi:hypothetical protein
MNFMSCNIYINGSNFKFGAQFDWLKALKIDTIMSHFTKFEPESMFFGHNHNQDTPLGTNTKF